jgi:hypothetical protein
MTRLTVPALWISARGWAMERTTMKIIDERQMLLLCMITPPQESKKVRAAREEIIEVVRAWHRGELLPREQAPILSQLYAAAHWGPRPDEP